MDRFEEIRVFAAVAQLESFSVAARLDASSLSAIHAALTAVEAGAGLTQLHSCQVAASEVEGGVRCV